MTMLFSKEVVIVNVETVDTISRSDIKKIYLSKKRWWSDGRKIRVVSYFNDKVGNNFTTNYLNRSLSQVILYWKQLMFTGRASMPIEVKHSDDMIKAIVENRDAIGYIDESLIDSLPVDIRVLSFETDKND